MSGYLDQLKSNIARSVIAAALLLPAGAAMAQPSPSSQQIIDASLGKALAASSLKGATFVLADHADAVGSEEYNQDLSSRRADSVKRYLMEKFSLAPDHLMTAGYGKTRLKNKDNPKAPEYRRVEVVNMADK